MNIKVLKDTALTVLNTIARDLISLKDDFIREREVMRSIAGVRSLGRMPQAGDPQGIYRFNNQDIEWNGTEVTATTPSIFSAEETKTFIKSVSSYSRDDIASKSISLGIINANGSRWIPDPDTSLPIDGGVILNALDGVWIREVLDGKYNILWWGADATGSKDSTDAIQNAINYVYKIGGGTVFIPRGIFKIGGKVLNDEIQGSTNYQVNYLIRPKDNVDIEGIGKESVLKLRDGLLSGTDDMTSNAHIFSAVTLNNVSFRNFKIDGNGANNLNPVYNQATQQGIRNQIAVRIAQGGSNLEFLNITFENVAGANCISINGKGFNVRVKDCNFVNGGPWVGVKNPNNHDYSSGYSCWDYTIVDGCTFLGNKENDKFCGGFELHGSCSSVTNSYFEGLWPAVYLSDAPDKPSTNQMVSNCVMKDVFQGINFSCFSYGYKDAIVSNNIISLYKPKSLVTLEYPKGIVYGGGSWSEYGANVGNASNLDNIKIDNNIIKASESSDDSYFSVGIDIHSLWNSSITNNLFKDLGGHAIQWNGSAWGEYNSKFEHNQIINCCRYDSIYGVQKSAIALDWFIRETPYANTPNRSFTVDTIYITNNTIINTVYREYNNKGTLIGLKSEGRIRYAIRFVNMNNTKARKIFINSNNIDNVQHLYYYINDLNLSYKIGKVNNEVYAPSRIIRLSGNTISNMILYPNDIIQGSDGKLQIYDFSQPTYQIDLSEVSVTTENGSKIIKFSNTTDVAKLTVGAWVEFWSGSTKVYTNVERILSLDTIEVENPALVTEATKLSVGRINPVAID